MYRYECPSRNSTSSVLFLQDELSGAENNTNVVFLHTTVDDGRYFQQILAGTLRSRWEEQNQSLREITGTFRSEK